MFYVRKYTPTPRIDIETFIKDAEKFLKDPYTKEQAPKYPLTNIGYCGTTLVFELALAGFKKENIKVSYVGNVVTVKAVYDTNENDQNVQDTQNDQNTECECDPNCKCVSNEINYIQKNISNKDVCRKFYLANEYLGSDIKWKYVNGLLTVAVYPNDDIQQVDPSDDDEDLYSNCECVNKD